MSLYNISLRLKNFCYTHLILEVNLISFDTCKSPKWACWQPTTSTRFSGFEFTDHYDLKSQPNVTKFLPRFPIICTLEQW